MCSLRFLTNKIILFANKFLFLFFQKKKKGTISRRNRWMDDGWIGTREGGRKGGRGKKKDGLFLPKEKNH